MSIALEVIPGGRTAASKNALFLVCQPHDDRAAAIVDLVAAAEPSLEILAGDEDRIASCLQISKAFANVADGVRFHWRASDACPPPSDGQGHGGATPLVWSSTALSLRGVARSVLSSIRVQTIGVVDVSEAALDRPLRVAKAAGRRRVCLVSLERDDDLQEAARDRLDALFGRHAVIDVLGPAKAALLLARNQFPYDVIIALDHDAEVLNALCQQLSGHTPLFAKSFYTKNIVYSHACDFGAPQNSLTQSISGTIIAGVEALAIAGRYAGAVRLHNALLRALEDNLHTQAIQLIAPDSQELSDLEFVAAVKGRLGKKPSQLPAISYDYIPDQTKEESATRHLQLVPLS